MSNNYRVHYKKGDIEIEIESSDKDYVDQMLQKLLSPQASQSSLVEPAKQKRKSPQTGRRQGK
jgi:hypothetical protein